MIKGKKRFTVNKDKKKFNRLLFNLTATDKKAVIHNKQNQKIIKEKEHQKTN